MNKLTQTITGTKALSLMPSLGTIIQPAFLDKYVIPESFYDVYFRTLQSKKYPLLRPTLAAAKAGKIKLFNTSDPIDPSNKMVNLPSYFSTFVFKDAKGDFVSYVNASAKAGYQRNKAGEAISNSLDENATYAYLQSGATARIMRKFDTELTNNVKFVSVLSDIFSGLISTCIDVMYPIGGNTNSYVILVFLTIMYFLQVHIGYTPEQALSVAMKVKTVDPTVIKNNCVCYAESFGSGSDIQSGPVSIKMSNILDYFKALEKEFPFIKKDSINLRTLESLIVQRFGQPALLMPEHSASFVNMIQNAFLMSRIYKDNYIKSLIRPSDIQTINQILLVTSGE